MGIRVGEKDKKYLQKGDREMEMGMRGGDQGRDTERPHTSRETQRETCKQTGGPSPPTHTGDHACRETHRNAGKDRHTDINGDKHT